ACSPSPSPTPGSLPRCSPRSSRRRIYRRRRCSQPAPRQRPPLPLHACPWSPSASRPIRFIGFNSGRPPPLWLGFSAFPPRGFHLEGYFKQGKYAQAAALLGTFYVLIGTRRLWARPATVPFLLIASLLLLPEATGGGSVLANLIRFVTHDIVPAPLRSGDLAS